MIKALAATEAGAQLTPFEFEAGELGKNQVEITVSHCGVCHSDLSMIDNEWGASHYPLVPGHEVVGKVTRAGSAVTSLTLGETVGLGWQSGFCESCKYCDNGDHNLCSRAKATIIGRHGGFAEKVYADAAAVVSLPKGIDLAAAGPLFCGGITVFNPIVQFDIKPTDKVAVIGIGGLGHLALQFLNAWGCEVTAFSSSENKSAEAKELGAHNVLNSTVGSELESAENSFDFILCTVNVDLDWKRYLNTLAPRGRLHFVGVLTNPMAVSIGQLMGKQLQISSSPVGSPATIKQMLEFAVRHNIKPAVEVFPFDQANDAIAKLAKGDIRYRAVLELE